MGYEAPMPVQEEVIPFLLGEDNDVIALAQTGTGKTVAYGLPVLQKTDLHTFQTIAAILIGGASINKASIVNVIVGTFLFQGILAMTPIVINGTLSIDISEVIKIIVTNGMILYALTRRN